MIRLFTSGTHKGQAFTPEDIDNIAAKTQEFGQDDIPFVLGHPKKNLPIMGFVPKSALKVYDEEDGRSIGFEKEDADMSEESMEVLRSAGQNKLSVRLRDGIIAHIGLVRKAAVNKNNEQDFGALEGDFTAPDDLFETRNPLKRFFNMDKTPETTTPNRDFGDLEERLRKLEGEKADREAFELKRKKLSAEFSAEKYTHLDKEQLAECADFAALLPDSRQEEFKAFLAGLKAKPQPRGGSLIADFGVPAEDKRSTEDLLRDQIKAL